MLTSKQLNQMIAQKTAEHLFTVVTMAEYPSLLNDHLEKIAWLQSKLEYSEPSSLRQGPSLIRHVLMHCAAPRRNRNGEKYLKDYRNLDDAIHDVKAILS